MAGRPAAVSSAMVEAPARAIDDMGDGQPLRHVGQIGGHLRRDAVARIEGARLLHILRPRLMHDRKGGSADARAARQEPSGTMVERMVAPWLPPVTSTRNGPP